MPFTHGFRVKAVFVNANNVRPNSPVRIAGVNIGKVTKVTAYKGGDGNMSLVTMEIDKTGLPIHKDATLKVRPRIFLEGNEFVDLSPGTPSAPTIDDGDTIPSTQTAAPVQFDQVLTALQSDTRDDLKRLLEGYGTALTYAADRPPTTSSQDPDVKGKTARPGAERLHRLRAGRAEERVDRQPGVPRARRATTSPGWSTTPPRSPRRWATTRTRCRTSSPTSTRRWPRWPPSGPT